MPHLHYICIISKDANCADLWHFDLEKVINGYYKTYLGESFSFERSSDPSDRKTYQIDRISLNIDGSKLLVQNEFIKKFELDEELKSTLSAWVQKQHINQLSLIKNKKHLIENLVDKLIENDKNYRTGKFHRTPTVCMFAMPDKEFDENLNQKVFSEIFFEFMEGSESNGTIGYSSFHNPRFHLVLLNFYPVDFANLTLRKLKSQYY